MTHGGQEFALGAIRGFRGRFGALQLLLRALAYDHLPELRANVPHAWSGTLHRAVPSGAKRTPELR